MAGQDWSRASPCSTRAHKHTRRTGGRWGWRGRTGAGQTLTNQPTNQPTKLLCTSAPQWPTAAGWLQSNPSTASARQPATHRLSQAASHPLPQPGSQPPTCSKATKKEARDAPRGTVYSRAVPPTPCPCRTSGGGGGAAWPSPSPPPWLQSAMQARNECSGPSSASNTYAKSGVVQYLRSQAVQHPKKQAVQYLRHRQHSTSGHRQYSISRNRQHSIPSKQAVQHLKKKAVAYLMPQAVVMQFRERGGSQEARQGAHPLGAADSRSAGRERGACCSPSGFAGFGGPCSSSNSSSSSSSSRVSSSSSSGSSLVSSSRSRSGAKTQSCSG